MDLDYIREARRDGAFIDAEKPIWKNVPVNVAFGVVDAIGVVNNHFHPDDVWSDAEKWGSMPQDKPVYKTPRRFRAVGHGSLLQLLNCGFRIPVSAGSGSGVMTSWPGYERVYVHLDGAFSYDNWFAGLKAGHSFATNGPILLVRRTASCPAPSSRGRSPSISLRSMRVRRICSTVSKWFRMAKSCAPSMPASANFGIGVHVKMERPGWLAVRCFEPLGATIRYAHTSPFWFTQNGRLKVNKSDAQHWAEYLREIAASVKWSSILHAKIRKGAAVFNEASQIYSRLAGGR